MNNDPSALISFSAIWNPEPVSAQRMKLCTLLFDHVYFQHEMGNRNMVRYVQTITDSESLLKPTTEATLAAIWQGPKENQPSFSIYGENDQWPWDHADEALKVATLSVLKSSSAEELDANDFEMYKLGGYSMSEIEHWQKHYIDSAYIGSDFTTDVVCRMIAKQSEMAVPVQQDMMACPDLLPLSWDQIVQLRRSPYLVDFRRKYQELAEKREIQYLTEHYYRGLEAILDEVKPNVQKELFKAVIVNWPCPFINPVSVASSMYDVYKARQLKQNFGWLFFIKEVSNQTINN